jgi:ABC-type multidrug transport system fused ATPase/permease subunit
MDQIVVMEDGRVSEKGSPRTLLLQAGKEGVGESRYRKLMRVNGDRFLEEMIAQCKN